jgi:hypothetical protein
MTTATAENPLAVYIPPRSSGAQTATDVRAGGLVP